MDSRLTREQVGSMENGGQSGFPAGQGAPCLGKRRCVRFAVPLTVVAWIPFNYWEPLILPSPPSPISSDATGLLDQIENLSRKVSEERETIQQEESVIVELRREHEARKRAQAQITQIKRLAILDLQAECARIEQRLNDMKRDIQSMKQRCFLPCRRHKRRRHCQPDVSSNNLKKRIPPIWSTAPLPVERTLCLDIVPFA